MFLSDLLLSFVCCNHEPEHVHTYSKEWSYDNSCHWHKATCEHADEICDKAEHISDDGSITKKATCKEEGEITYRCIECKAIIRTDFQQFTYENNGFLQTAFTASAQEKI